MKKYVLFAVWLIAIIILGVLENSVALPVFSIGLLLFISKNASWWLRVLSLVLAALIWGSAMAVQPFALLIILAGGFWLDRWLSQKIQASQALLVVVGISVIAIGSLRQVPFSIWICLLFAMQMIAFFLISRYLPKLHAPIMFAVPVRSLRKVTDDA